MYRMSQDNRQRRTIPGPELRQHWMQGRAGDVGGYPRLPWTTGSSDESGRAASEGELARG